MIVSKREMHRGADAYAVVCRGEVADQIYDGYFPTIADAKYMAKLRVKEGKKEVQVWKYVWSPKAARRELHACQAVIHLCGGFDPAYVKDAAKSLKETREALAEYDATPAVEVTADAVEVAWATLPEVGKFSDGSWKIITKPDMQAALAAALPALTQQVERVTAERDFHIADAERLARNVTVAMNDRDRFIAERDTLSAENARLAKDAERYKFWRKYYGSRFALVLPGATLRFAGWKPEVEQALHDYEPKVDAAIDAAIKQDAATAQAKQSPEKIP